MAAAHHGSVCYLIPKIQLVLQAQQIIHRGYRKSCSCHLPRSSTFCALFHCKPCQGFVLAQYLQATRLSHRLWNTSIEEMGSRTNVLLENRSSIVEVATYALTGMFVLFFIARQIMKAIVFRKLALDDLFILLATVSVVTIYRAIADTDRHLQLVYQ